MSVTREGLIIEMPSSLDIWFYITIPLLNLLELEHSKETNICQLGIHYQ